MSRKKFVALAGREFEVYNTLYATRNNRRRTLYDVYRKPSDLNVAIYNDWVNWLNCCSENDNDFITVESYNEHFFTLSGVVTISNETYAIYITPRHNYCAKVSRELRREVKCMESNNIMLWYASELDKAMTDIIISGWVFSTVIIHVARLSGMLDALRTIGVITEKTYNERKEELSRVHNTYYEKHS